MLTLALASAVCAWAGPSALAHLPRTRTLGAFMSDASSSTCCSIDAVASQAASAMSRGHALVHPGFLSGASLDAARADMASVLSQIPKGDSTEFESIQTDLLNLSFRQQMPAPLPFAQLLGQLDALRAALRRATGRALLEGGGLHLMRYPVGTKFMRHVDEDASLYEPTRNSISFLLYLTPDDWSESDGGALQIYEADGDGEAREVLPVAGTLVIYDSTVEHEVLPTRRERHLISGRYRESNDEWSRRRQ
jgi:Rps23 Pro-64 3,4-dihydroxylase Tpa1-like proline 4-hydroxylase